MPFNTTSLTTYLHSLQLVITWKRLCKLLLFQLSRKWQKHYGIISTDFHWRLLPLAEPQFPLKITAFSWTSFHWRLLPLDRPQRLWFFLLLCDSFHIISTSITWDQWIWRPEVYKYVAIFTAMTCTFSKKNQNTGVSIEIIRSSSKWMKTTLSTIFRP